MTTVATPHEQQDVAPPRESPKTEAKPGLLPPRAQRRVIRISAIGLLVAAGLLLVFLAFEGPVGRVWYETRQRQLASDLAKPHPKIERGDAIGVLQIPRLGVNLVVAEGDDPQQLRGGPGHRRGSAMPGTKGNAVVVGHRSAWGGPFAEVDRLKKGDLVAVSIGTQPEPVVYTVTGVERVSGNDTRPFAKSTDFRLTLISGDGGRLSADRVVVTAVSGNTQRATPEGDTRVRASTSAGSKTLNLPMLLIVLGCAGALLAYFVLRKKTAILPLVAALIPLGALALLGLLLEVDLFLPSLR